MFITCPTGVEQLLIDELQELGIPAREGFRGVYVAKTIENVYKINYCSRLAMRVLWPLLQFRCRDKNDLYAHAKKIEWEKYLSLQKTFAIDANVTHPSLKNSLYAALVVKDAICDRFRDQTGERPSVDIKDPDIQLNLFIHNGQATLSFDTSLYPLHKRGYRQEAGAAPLQETLAAAILRFCNYTSSDILCDPFCGSGTFLIEAAMIATHTPAGFFRSQWGFQYLPEYTEEKWSQIKQEADQKRIPLPKGKIFGADKERSMVLLSRQTLDNLDFEIEIFHQEVKKFEPPASPTLIVTNPPYGRRLESAPLHELTDFLKKAPRFGVLCPGSLPQIRPHKQIPLSSGGLDVLLHLKSL